MQEHCISVLKKMPRKVGPSDTAQFSITLPSQAVAMMKELETSGLYGSSRAEVARGLILAQLTYLAGQGIVELKKGGQ